MSEVYDGKSGLGSRLGTETTITVGMMQHPPPAYGHRHKRSFSRSSNRSEEKIPPPSGTGGGLWPVVPAGGYGGIEKKTMFETVTEECGSSSNSERSDSRSDAASDKDTKYSASVYSQDSIVKDDDVPEVPKLPKTRDGDDDRGGRFF